MRLKRTKRTVEIEIQDFEKIRRENIFYVDKTHFIKECAGCFIDSLKTL